MNRDSKRKVVYYRNPISQSRLASRMIIKYLRELSIVVLGVAITISVGSYLSRRSDQVKLAQYLNAVKLELEENGRVVEQFQEYYTQLREYG